MAYIEEMLERYPQLKKIRYDISAAYELIKLCFENEGKLLVAGNGGSAADSEHICGELMKGFKCKRPIANELKRRIMDVDMDVGKNMSQMLERPLTVVPLVAHEALLTAYSNDANYMYIFAQQLLGYGRNGDVLLAISTSGNSSNVINASVLAKAMGISVIGLTGENGGKLCQYADVMVRVPETEAYLVQELHLPIYHCWCMMVEEHFFG